MITMTIIVINNNSYHLQCFFKHVCMYFTQITVALWLISKNRLGRRGLKTECKTRLISFALEFY